MQRLFKGFQEMPLILQDSKFSILVVLIQRMIHLDKQRKTLHPIFIVGLIAMGTKPLSVLRIEPYQPIWSVEVCQLMLPKILDPHLPMCR